MTIKEAIDKYINYISAVLRVSKNTEISYLNDLYKFNDFCNLKNITELAKINEKNIKQYIIHLNYSKISASSISRNLASLRGFTNFCLEHNFITNNPLQYIKNPKVKRKLPETVNSKSIEEIFGLIKDHNYSEYEKLLVTAIIDITYSCALRVSEVCNLKLNDLDIKNGTLRVFGKGSKFRIVPIGPKTLNNLSEYLKVRNSINNNLFILKSGNPIYSKFVYRITNQFLGMVADTKKKSPHVLRHASATHMLDEGADLLAVKEILGHENLSTTQIYTHVSIDRLKKTYKTAHPKS